ncbi:pyridoxamine 5'-phosphate oxidase [Oceaniglobus indicus]|uniref:pyridoxamine 5'-phosphate oxidase n=1 Tax=Oceaniglobus indicus TaxID=2047749 RepID=UPI000C18C014|nr:pyridoxamine 5'-phosphate oxidase [Oceaniglobus indicus]
MSDTTTPTESIFGATDPFALAQAWMDEAAATEPNDPNAIALATVDPDGMPNVRVVLLKEIEADAFVFYTNYEGDKGREIDATGVASFVMHWKTLRRQVRVRGHVSREDGALADEYYNSRPLDSRLGAWASAQSRPLDDRQTLIDGVEAAREKFGDSPPRPPFWGGYRIRPVSFEFWHDGAFRLHDRERWLPDETQGKWQTRRLYP